MAFINVEVVSGIFHWTTVIAITLAAVALAYKIIAILRDGYLQKKQAREDDDYYPPQESDDYVTLFSEKEYTVNEYETVEAGTYILQTGEESVAISINGIKRDYINGDEIILTENDVICSLFVTVILNPKTETAEEVDEAE